MSARRSNKEWAAVLKDANRRGVYAAALARELGLANETVYSAIKRTGIILFKCGSHSRAPKDWPRLLRDAKRRGLCPADLAQELSLTSPSDVQYWEKTIGVRLPRKRKSASTRRGWPEKLKAAVQRGETFNAFCYSTGIGSAGVAALEHRTGLKLRRTGKRGAHR